MDGAAPIGTDGLASAASDPDAVGTFLRGWVRAERAFRGREVWRHHAAPDGSTLDRVRYLVIRELVHGGPRRLSDLADLIGVTPSHGSRVVDSLVHHGLVVRTVPDGDRRVTVISVPPPARELLRVMDDERRELIAHPFSAAGFSPKETLKLALDLQRFADEAERWAFSDRHGSNTHDHLASPG
jgi:MarR family transcriptional regulator for hemolysin